MVSHELRTPMNAILGISRMLLEEEPLSERARERLEAARRSGHALLAIMNDILDYSRLDAGAVRLEEVDIAVDSLIDEICLLEAEHARRRGVRLLAWVDPSMPRHVHGDIGRIRQVLINLVDNAVKFTERGDVEISACAEERGVALYVRDTGIGIAPDLRARILEPFEQGQSGPSRPFGGAGLGLAICQELVRAMRGILSFDSEVGRGSTFRVWLPLVGAATIPLRQGLARVEVDDPALARASRAILTRAGWRLDDEASEPPQLRVTYRDGRLSVWEPTRRWDVGAPFHPSSVLRPATSEASVATGPLEGLRVLLADDDATNQRVGRWMLERLGARVDCVADGREALAVLGELTYDAVLLDAAMPVMDGFEAARRIRAGEAGPADTPLFLLTASDTEHARQRAEEVGIDAFMTKPIEPEILTRVLAPLRESATPALFEASLVDSLRQALDEESFTEIIDSFESDTAQVAASFRTSADGTRVDDAQMRAMAHRLRGAAASVGAVHLAEAASQVEQHGATDARCDAVVDAWQVTVDALRERRFGS